ncbi:hypothetical protein CHU95_14620 [Niveispirillum lacus]|uniref:ABC transporter permease n=1 Tax=Niveispirillum lacus TaxID=1981099 RepID=A0A255YWN2_9PROT|nr:ABC transporter permease [Niveispirillum lacus]OYQ33608.1 hypothetical protein CHU95_14620 [Niveispirillum lacus]
MLRNWILVAVRNLMRHKLYTAINVVGLAVGLAAALLIMVFVRHELSYNERFTQIDDVWRVNRTMIINDRAPEATAAISMPVGPALTQDFPEIVQAVRAARVREVVRRGGDSLYQLFTAVDPDYFSIFDWHFLAGDPATALAQPNTTVLTLATAEKLFGTSNVLDRTVELGSGVVLRVTGVIENPPLNVTHRPEALIALSTPLQSIDRTRDQWGWNWIDTYVRLAPGADARRIEAALPDFLRRNNPAAAEYERNGDRTILTLQPVRDIHTAPLNADEGTSMAMISGLLALAFLILGIAGINFVNLATARATTRAREVAMRKTLGASRALLVLQFLAESVLLTFIAGLIAVALVEILLPTFQDMMSMAIEPDYRSLASMVVIATGLSFGLGVLGGFYPALVLSGFRPAHILRGSSKGGAGAGRLRAILVVVQFAVAIALTVGTFVVLQQTRYASSQRLGFDKDNVVLLRGMDNPAALPRMQMLKQRLAADPGVVAVAGAPWVPSDTSETTSTYRRTDDGQGAAITIRTDLVDFGYFEVLGARLLAGRTFDENYGTDAVLSAADGKVIQGRTAATVLSLTAVRQLGWGDASSALGRTLLYPDDGGDVTLTVVGVVEDLQYRSARDRTVATVYQAAPDATGTLMVRVRPDTVPAVLNRIDSLWKELVPEVPVRRQFLDERIEQLYALDVRQGQLFAAFAGLAVIIACLGLFGLASFTAERRTKEIGIRKVLGASVADLVRLLVWQFSRPVLLANLIAWPVAWYGLSRWLEGFAYRIDLNPLLFLAAGGGALLIAWVTVAGQAARVAVEKPIKALRYE